MSTSAIDSLLRHAIDYAGVFPPASLPAADAVAEYLRVRSGTHGWLLGTFVVSSDRLAEITHRDLPLSVVMREASPAAVADILHAGSRMNISAIEVPLVRAEDVAGIAKASPPDVRMFFEVPATGQLDASLDAIAKAGAFAKIRTGGVIGMAFPEATVLYHFLQACMWRSVVCKATAGLHHAVAGRYPMTYEHGGPWWPMFGFLNVCIAAGLVYLGAPKDDVVAVLKERVAHAFVGDDDSVSWREYRLSVRDIEAMRRSLFASFGSCSVQEPIDDLVRMQLA